MSSSYETFFDLDRKVTRLKDLEARQAEPAFWADSARAREQVAEIRMLKGWISPYQQLVTRLDDAAGLVELLAAEPDAALARELDQELARASQDLERFELQTMLQGPDDGRDALLTIHPGAGGTESQDWAEMLMRMYVRWAERKGFTVSILDLMPGEEAGIKSVTIEIDLREEDIKMDVFRASGAGGQHVNKTSSAVRLTHVPTGTVVSCQQERSQFKNRDVAMKMLRAALYQLKLEEQQAASALVEATKTDNSWGNQIRSYVFQPYTMVNDHRTELKVTDVQKVMDGDLDGFIEAYLKRFGAKAA